MTPLRGLTDPVGPESPQIYWVRRLVLLIAAVVVVALVIAGIAKLVGGRKSRLLRWFRRSLRTRRGRTLRGRRRLLQQVHPQ